MINKTHEQTQGVQTTSKVIIKCHVAKKFLHRIMFNDEFNQEILPHTSLCMIDLT